jgi:hypothetical protein
MQLKLSQGFITTFIQDTPLYISEVLKFNKTFNKTFSAKYTRTTMFRALRLFRTLNIPSNTPNQYNFDPKLMGFGSRVFDPSETQGRVSQEEFEILRGKMITTGGSDLSSTKCLMITMCITFPLGFLIFVARIIARICGVDMSITQLIIYIVCCIVPNIIIGCAFRYYSNKANQILQAALNEENRNYFISKGVSFKIASTLKYMTMTFQNSANINQPSQGYAAPPMTNGYNPNYNYAAQPGYAVSSQTQPGYYGQTA